MKLSHLLLATCAAISIAGCGNNSTTQAGGGAAANPDQAYTLKLDYKTGDKWVYDVSVDMTADVSGIKTAHPEAAAQIDAMGTDHHAKISAEETSTVTKAEGGKFTLSNTFANPHEDTTGIFKMGGPKVDEMMKPSTVELDAHGKSTSNNADDQMEFAPGLPDKPIKVGESFQITVGTGANAKQVTGKLVGTESVDGKNLLRIEYTGYAPKGATANGPFVMLFDPEAGVVHSLSGSVAMEQGGAKMQMKMDKKLKK